MFVPLFIAMLGFAALAVDVGLLLVEQRGLQNGADASAIAVARDCVAVLENPPGATPCTDDAALATANAYLAANSVVAATAGRTLSTSLGGKVGTITVTGRTSQLPVFGQALGVNAPLDVIGAARARWGPVTAHDDVFPLVVCKGALSAPDGAPETLTAQPWFFAIPFECQGSPFRPPFGWMPPSDPAACTAAIDLLVPTAIDVQLAQNEPAAAGCAAAINDLHDDIDTGTAEERTRVLAIYDHQSGVSSARPAWALVAFEFTGAKLGGRISHTAAGAWVSPCDPTDANLRCIEGIVRHHVPVIDGPVVDPAVASFPGINDSTVLDVRLMD